MDKLIHDSWNVCECLTLNEMHIQLASLIVCLINYNLTNTLSTPPPEVKKTVLYIVHLIIFSSWKESSIYLRLRLKSLTYFKHQQISFIWKQTFLYVLFFQFLVLIFFICKYYAFQQEIYSHQATTSFGLLGNQLAKICPEVN